ncbi:HNH endonuclease [Streptomyces bacillaris]
MRWLRLTSARTTRPTTSRGRRLCSVSTVRLRRCSVDAANGTTTRTSGGLRSVLARVRALVGARGGARCARCGSLTLAGSVDVDHVQPLALGGEDTDQNIQPLCRDCHRVKTGEDFPGGVSPTS